MTGAVPRSRYSARRNGIAGGKARLIGAELGRLVGLHRRVEGPAVCSEDFLDALCRGGIDSPSFADKLKWLDALRKTLDARILGGMPIVLGGDFNIAADERDVYDAERMRGQLHFHEKEHAALKHLLDFGLYDAFRLHHEAGQLFSWWDYRGASLRLNQGLRIDYLFLSHALKERGTSAEMVKEVRLRDKPSDHIPVVIELADGGP